MIRLLVVALLAACGGAGTSTALETLPVPPAETGRDGVHGMVLFGERAVFVSHIPMLHEPHDVQWVARVRVRQVDGKLPHGYADRLYTISPERFKLDALLSGERRSFRADVYKGNFEDGGEKLGVAEITLEKVLVQRPLEGGEPDDEYYVFGGGEEWWAIHRIGGSPSFDSVSRVSFGRNPDAGRFRLPGEKRLAKGQFLEGPRGNVTVTEAHEMTCLVGPKFMSACP